MLYRYSGDNDRGIRPRFFGPFHNLHTFVGAPEVQELTFLRDQNRQLMKMIAGVKAENKRLKRRVEKRSRQ